MKYFLDTEFIESFHKPSFGKRRHFIDLISIGIVAEDGREYYAISNEFKEDDASPWVREHVISKLKYSTNARTFFGERASKEAGKSNKQIAIEIYQFVTEPFSTTPNINRREEALMWKYNPSDLPLFEFYGYYSDYDWVLLCSLFGTMINLPFGFPMYCRDLKQMLDETLENKIMTHLPAIKGQEEINSNSNISLNHKLTWAKSLSHYPKQSNEHNALSDAQWNKQLFDFIKTIQ